MPKRDPSCLLLAPDHLTPLRQLLRTHVPQAEVWAYGSRVNGDAHEGSDLDLVLRNPADLRAPCTGSAALKLALQDSLLPMLVDVHDWANLPGRFQQNIERGYVVLQAGSACSERTIRN